MLHLFHPQAPDPKQSKEYLALMDNLSQTKAEIDRVYSTFENVTDPDLIDASIYQLNSAQLRYRFLLNSVKEYQ
ncbi:MAG: YaaL family protein [Lachnospiraceae bacterium]|nr:YaaL family protein [Lachnospiraceae bacterium]MDY3818698.1 YaaL family protein [Lachnospiraceae bacterium]